MGKLLVSDTMVSVSPSVPLTEDAVRSALRGVVDPELGDNVVDLGMVTAIRLDGGQVTVVIALTIAGCPLRTQLRNDVETRVSALEEVTAVIVETGVMDAEQKAAVMARARWKARESDTQTEIPPNARVIAIASGKGGVGKSSVTVNLATALATRGLTVGVLDADIAGFSIPRLLGIDDRLVANNGKIEPAERVVGDGLLKVVSMGLIEGSGEDEAVMLRGLMLNRALQHFLQDVKWGKLDYLIIDMPPGTGDVQMGLARMMPRADMLVVTTPSLAAQQVAARVIDMARRGYLRVAGIVENMSTFTTEDGKSYELFGSGGGERLAHSTGVPLLVQIPLDPDVATAGDTGTPVVTTSDGPTAKAFTLLAERVATDIAPVVEMNGCTSRLLEAAAAVFDN